MIKADEDALACDLMETYGVLDYRALPPTRAACLAAGLRNDSRIKMKMIGARIDLKTHLLAAVFDKINWLCWTHTKDAQHNRNQPRSILEILTEEKKEKNEGAFDSPEAFENARRKALNKK